MFSFYIHNINYKMKFALVSFLTLCVSVVTFAQNPMNAGIASTHPPLNVSNKNKICQNIELNIVTPPFFFSR